MVVSIGGKITAMQITSLHRYPIKGCRGHVVEQAALDILGIADDRRLMLVDARGRFVSQRELPQLATITPELDGPMLSVRAGAMHATHELDWRGPLRSVTIWGDVVEATDQGDAMAEWFSEAAGAPLRLVAFGHAARRPIDPDFTPRDDAETAFTDGYPLLVVVQESLDALNAALEVPVPMSRFRPSVVVQGAPAWSEDRWRTLAVGPLVMDAVKPCARCVVTTTDQATGVRDPHQEPLRTLARLHTIQGFGAIFGMNVVPRSPGTLAVGDVMTLVAHA